MRIAAFVVAGVLTGLFSGSLGVGGSLLATPLVRFLGITPYLAIGTTVPAMLPTALTGALTYWRNRMVSVRAALGSGIPGALAAVGGAAATRRFDGHALMLLTAAILLVLSIRLFPTRRDEELAAKPRDSLTGFIAVGTIAGFFSGLLGIGGGFLLVPAYIKLFRMPIKLALGTSLAVITIMVGPNIAAQSAVSNIDWPVAGLLSLGVIPGALAGARMSIRASERRLRYVLASVLLIVAVAYASIELRALFSA